MNYFIKQLCIGVNLMIILNNCLCKHDFKITNEVNELADIIKEYANNGRIIVDESNSLNIKPLKKGKLGFGANAIVWKSIIMFYFI